MEPTPSAAMIFPCEREGCVRDGAIYAAIGSALDGDRLTLITGRRGAIQWAESKNDAVYLCTIDAAILAHNFARLRAHVGQVTFGRSNSRVQADLLNGLAEGLSSMATIGSQDEMQAMYIADDLGPRAKSWIKLIATMSEVEE